jgi:hypothetical protein
LITQILYPQCSRWHHFASWKKHFLEGQTLPPTTFSLSRVSEEKIF